MTQTAVDTTAPIGVAGQLATEYDESNDVDMAEQRD